jgi:hypothetical protein
VALITGWSSLLPLYLPTAPAHVWALWQHHDSDRSVIIVRLLQTSDSKSPRAGIHVRVRGCIHVPVVTRSAVPTASDLSERRESPRHWQHTAGEHLPMRPSTNVLSAAGKSMYPSSK